MINHFLVDTCKKVTMVRNVYNDVVDNSSYTDIACRFRYISTYQKTTNRESNETEAMLWVGASSGLVRGDTILYDSVYYRIERINKARRAGEMEVQFLKCDLVEVSIGIS